MIESVTAAAKFKALIAAFSLLILGGSLYTLTGEHGIITDVKTEDPFTKDIQRRADLVENAVMEAVNQQGKQSPLVYKQTCESVMSTIRGERLDTEYNYNTLDASQKELIQSYRVYLQEAADVVVTCYRGETPDLTKMNAAKAKLS
jgi:parvulin-like peptidyl-prolyl isomerase